MSLEQLRRGKATELDILSTLVKADWEVYVPVLDAFQTDIVIHKPPATWYRLQIKHREEGNEFKQLSHNWTHTPMFDLLIVITGRGWGLILPRETVCKSRPISFSSDSQSLHPDLTRFSFNSGTFITTLERVITNRKAYAEAHLRALPNRGKVKPQPVPKPKPKGPAKE